MSVSEFLKVQKSLHDPAHVVGTEIVAKEFRVIGNGPGLMPVGVDPLGRLWSEDSGLLTCVYDPRPKPWNHT